MILEFNFISASSEGSDEPVHLHTLARALSILITQNMLADEDSDQILANTNNIHQICIFTSEGFVVSTFLGQSQPLVGQDVKFVDEP